MIRAGNTHGRHLASLECIDDAVDLELAVDIGLLLLHVCGLVDRHDCGWFLIRSTDWRGYDGQDCLLRVVDGNMSGVLGGIKACMGI